MVSLSWKEVRALSLLMVPLLTSSSPAAARPDENIRLSIPQREALHAARLNERNLRHQSIYESGGWRQVRNAVEISSRRGFEASPTGVPVVNLRPDVINRHIFRGVSRGGFPQLAQTNLGQPASSSWPLVLWLSQPASSSWPLVLWLSLLLW